MKKILFIVPVILLWIYCAGNKAITTKQHSRLIIPTHWTLEIVADDIRNYPQVKLRAIVRDSSGNFVKNLAPPFGHHEDWQTIWTPLIQKHPKWGEKEIKKIKVIEIQFERIDTTRLAKLQQEKKVLELQLMQSQSPTRFQEAV